MKKHLLILMLLGFAVSLFSQHHVIPNRGKKNLVIRKSHSKQQQKIGTKSPAVPAYKNSLVLDESIIGNTFYDLQTNATMQNRIFVYDDGTIGSIFTFSGEPSFGDRGTGYNYYDGSDWDPEPTERIESIKTGWPSYAPFGENGELIVSHDFNNGKLIILKRDEKGTGSWSEEEFLGPDDVPISWNSATTSGINHDVIQLLTITWPASNTPAGPVYQGLDGALLYSRSADGGANWDYENEVLEGLSSTYYAGFSADMYRIVSEGENNVAILVGDDWMDLVLMKSNDGGDTWTKTVIWEHPFPFFDHLNPIATDGFYAPDGSHHLAFDQSGKVHVVFGITWSQYTLEPQAGYWTQYTLDGLGYWNEDRPLFSADTNALSPYGEVGTELIDDYSLIGWSQDLNGNDTIDLQVLNDPPYYGHSMSSMPQILIDEQNRIFVVYSSITEGYTSGDPEVTCRHLWCRTSPNGEWWGSFTDLTAPFPTHIIDDCVFPSIANYSDDSFYLVYQYDNVPGNSLQGNNPAPTAVGENFIAVMTVSKDEVWTSIKENNIPIFDYDVSQNFPNPFNGTSTVNVNIRQTTELSLEVINMMGQVVYTIDAGIAKPGMNTITIDGSNLTPGIYFYTVKAGESAITKKMIVD